MPLRYGSALRVAIAGSGLPQRKRQLYRHQDRDRFAEPSTRRKAPLSGRFDRLLIEAERRIERPDDLHVPDRAIRLDDALKEHGALNFRAHRIGGVLRLDFAQDARQRHTAARSVHAPARSAPASRTEAGSVSRADAASTTGAGTTSGA